MLTRQRGSPAPLVHHFGWSFDDSQELFGRDEYHHGAPFARAVEEGLLDPARTVQIGIRGSINDRDVFGFLTDEGLIPNYAFPEAGVTLRSVIFRKRMAEDGWIIRQSSRRSN